MLHIFTFCVDIKRFPQTSLVRALKMLVKSLDSTNEYKLHVFTNFNIDYNHESVKYHKYFDDGIHFTDRWLNLSFNKIQIWKHLYDEYNINFIWMDLDTIITKNIEYLNMVDNVFIDINGQNETLNYLFTNNTQITIPRNKSIQGNFWKINIDLYNIFMNTYSQIKEKKLNLIYDLQSLFTFYFYHVKTNLDSINILGRNYKPEVLSGLSMWSKNDSKSHPNLTGLETMFWDDNILRTKFHPEKEIHIVSLTFYTLEKLYTQPGFNNLFKN